MEGELLPVPDSGELYRWQVARQWHACRRICLTRKGGPESETGPASQISVSIVSLIG